MKRAITVGLFTGFVSGILRAVLIISGIYELFSVSWLFMPVGIQHIILFSIIQNSFWGIVYCLLFAFFYDYIPFKGVKKGVIFGLIIWIAVSVHPASLLIGYGFHQFFIPMTFIAFISTCVVYGSLIGILYKKE